MVHLARILYACPVLFSALLLCACGGGNPTPTTGATGPIFSQALTRSVEQGQLSSVVHVEFQVPRAAEIKTASFIVHTKPHLFSEDMHVTYTRSYLDRTNAIDTARGTIRFPVFGLYGEYENQVSVELSAYTGETATQSFTVSTVGAPQPRPPTHITIEESDPDLDVSFLLLQAFDDLIVVDVDGEERWRGPVAADAIFPRMFTPQGLVVGSRSSPAVYRYDWAGQAEIAQMSDASCTESHHNFAPGRDGILNTVSVTEVGVPRGYSVLVEMTKEAEVLHRWDFDQIVADTIEAGGEDPSSLVQRDYNWFHMNSAIYDASDSSVIVSSRENFVIKADHATGKIKWILGNPEKKWFTDFPASLQPLTLAIQGDPPIGQHALSVSGDGRFLMLFNNGQGHFNLPDIGDTRGYSKVSIYEIDEEARTAIEVWTYDHGGEIFSPICSGAVPTKAGNVIVTYSSPSDGDDNPIIEVVDRGSRVLFRARVEGPGCFATYSAESVPFEGLLID